MPTSRASTRFFSPERRVRRRIKRRLRATRRALPSVAASLSFSLITTCAAALLARSGNRVIMTNSNKRLPPTERSRSSNGRQVTRFSRRPRASYNVNGNGEKRFVTTSVRRASRLSSLDLQLWRFNGENSFSGLQFRVADGAASLSGLYVRYTREMLERCKQLRNNNLMRD